MKIVSRIRDWRRARKLTELTDAEQPATKAGSLPTIQREAHETYKLGSCTLTVLGSGPSARAELKTRMAQHRMEADRSLATRAGRLNEAGGGALARGLTEDQILDLAKRGEAEEAAIAGPTVAPPSGKTK